MTSRSYPVSVRARPSWSRGRFFSKRKQRNALAAVTTMHTEAGVINRIMTAAFARPAFTILVVLAAAIFGAASFQHLRRDVFPDLTAPVFNVIVQNAAMGAEELEAAVAIPLETALAGLPEIRRVR